MYKAQTHRDTTESTKGVERHNAAVACTSLIYVHTKMQHEFRLIHSSTPEERRRSVAARGEIVLLLCMYVCSFRVILSILYLPSIFADDSSPHRHRSLVHVPPGARWLAS